MARAGSKTLIPMGPKPRIPTFAPFHGDGLLHSIHSNGQGLRDGCLVVGHDIGDWNARGLRHHNKFGQGTLRLARTTQEAQLPAGMRPSGLTLVTFPTWHGRFDGDPVPWLHPGHSLPYGFHLPRAFMPDGKRVLYHLAPIFPDT